MPRLIASLGFAAGILASTSVWAVEISISCSALGKENEICKQGVDAWAKRTGNTVKITICHPKLRRRRMAGLEGIMEQFLDGHEFSPTRAVLVKSLG